MVTFRSPIIVNERSLVKPLRYCLDSVLTKMPLNLIGSEALIFIPRFLPETNIAGSICDFT